MLQDAGLNKVFWPYAFKASNYTLNRIHTSTYGQIHVLYTTMTQRKFNINHFKAFGCKSYVHVPDRYRKKLDDKAKVMIFIGYSDTSLAYLFFDPDSKTVHVSAHVTFDEHATVELDNMLNRADDQSTTSTTNQQKDYDVVITAPDASGITNTSTTERAQHTNTNDIHQSTVTSYDHNSTVHDNDLSDNLNGDIHNQSYEQSNTNDNNSEHNI
jgi:hypothetical protein